MRISDKQREEAGMWLYVRLQEAAWRPPPKEEQQEWLWYEAPTRKYLREYEELPQEKKDEYVSVALSTAEALLDLHLFRLRCGYCGAFVPFKNAREVYDGYSGASGSEWKCNKCSETTSEL